MPVLILGTYRDVELDVARPLARALQELTRQRLAHDLALKRLPEAEVAAMLRALSGQEPPAPLVQAVYRETEGNPFFVEEVFQHLAEEGKLFDAQGRWRPDLSIGELEVPRGVRLVIGRRLERVCEDCRRRPDDAAVIGRGFSFELLEALGDVGADALLDAVDEAERAHLITSTADGPEARFTFAHELIRQTLVSGLSLPRRQRLHLRVAEAMERVYARTLEEHAADLAHHLYQAGTPPSRRRRRATCRWPASGPLRPPPSRMPCATTRTPSPCSRPMTGGAGRPAVQAGAGPAQPGPLGGGAGRLAGGAGHLRGAGRRRGGGTHLHGHCYQLGWGARFEESLEIGRRGLAALGEGVSAERCRLLGNAGRTLS